MGHSARSRWEVLIRGSVINRLVDLLPETDIHIIAERPEPRM
jgi:K+-sensing histidine kinase KdpD